MIRTIIVENEQPQIDRLKGLLVKHFTEIELVAVCNNIPEGIEQVNLLNPDLIFLDIELPPYNGFDLLEQVKDCNAEVIFTTSYSQYAKKAIKFCALDYLEKPYLVEELIEAVNRYKNLMATRSKKKIDALLHNVRQTDNAMQKVGIPVIGGFEFITVSEIIMCQATDNCTDFHLTNKRKITATKTLKWVETLMMEHNFFRVHDSYLINLNHIKKYNRGGEGGVVELTDRIEADVARRRKEAFLKKLSDLGIIFNK